VGGIQDVRKKHLEQQREHQRSVQAGQLGEVEQSDAQGSAEQSHTQGSSAVEAPKSPQRAGGYADHPSVVTVREALAEYHNQQREQGREGQGSERS
jgi:hypothetical protein